MTEYFPSSIFKETISLLSPALGLQESEAHAYIVLNKIFEISRTDIIVNRQFIASGSQKERYDQVINRLIKNEPIQYIFEEAEFYGHTFYVDKNVLIPRQETELLIQIISNFRDWNNPKIADIGTGSGCIACSLALSINNSQVVGYDISEKALRVARRNAKDLNVNVDFMPLDILTAPIPNNDLDLIVSNPPYVMDKEKIKMRKNVLDFEPGLALFVPDENPLLFYRTIVEKGQASLKKGGALFFEINEQFGEETSALFVQNGYSEPKIYEDLNGKPRFASAVLN